MTSARRPRPRRRSRVLADGGAPYARCRPRGNRLLDHLRPLQRDLPRWLAAVRGQHLDGGPATTTAPSRRWRRSTPRRRPSTSPSPRSRPWSSDPPDDAPHAAGGGGRPSPAGAASASSPWPCWPPPRELLGRAALSQPCRTRRDRRFVAVRAGRGEPERNRRLDVRSGAGHAPGRSSKGSEKVLVGLQGYVADLSWPWPSPPTRRRAAGPRHPASDHRPARAAAEEGRAQHRRPDRGHRADPAQRLPGIRDQLPRPVEGREPRRQGQAPAARRARTARDRGPCHPRRRAGASSRSWSPAAPAEAPSRRAGGDVRRQRRTVTCCGTGPERLWSASPGRRRPAAGGCAGIPAIRWWPGAPSGPTRPRPRRPPRPAAASGGARAPRCPRRSPPCGRPRRHGR